MPFADSNRPEDQALAARLRADPRVQALVNPGGGRNTATTRMVTLDASQLRALGYEVPEGYHYSFGARAGDGYLSDNSKGWLERNGPRVAAGMFIAGGGIAAAPYIAGVAGGGGGAAAASGATKLGATTINAAGLPVNMAVGSGLIPPAVSAGGAGFMGLSPRSWLDVAIFGGQMLGGVWGTKQQVGASDRAAEAELQANREALAFLREQWNVARADFAPYLALGHASAGRLSDYVTNTPAPTMPANLRQQMEGGYDPQTYTPRPGWTPPAPRPAPTPAPTRRDLDYWSARGMSPIGENGQLAPDWRRTANGYEFDGAAQTPPTLGGSFGRPKDVIDLSRRPDGVWGTQPVPTSGGASVLPEGQDPYITGTPFHPGDPKANPTPIPLTPEQIENDRRRRASEAAGYGWGGRRPGDPPPTLGGSFGRAPVSTTQPVSMQRIRVQAPDGEIRELPRDQANFFISRGARLVA